MSTHLLDEEQYIEDGYIDASYFGGLIEGELRATGYFVDAYIDESYFDFAGISVALTATLTLIVQDLAADLTSTSSINIDVDKIKSFTASMSASASVGSVCNITANGNSNVDVDCAITVDIGRITTDGASFSSAITAGATGTRVRFVSVDVESQVTQTTAGNAIFGCFLDTFSEAFVPLMTVRVLKGDDLDFVSDFLYQANVERYRGLNATTLDNIINLNAQADKKHGIIANLQSQANISATILPLKLAETNVSAIFTANINGTHIKNLPANLYSSFHQGVDTGDNDFTTNVEAIFPLDALLNATTTTSIDNDRLRRANTNFDSIASQISAAGFLQDDIADLVSSYLLLSNIGVIKPFDIDLTASSQISNQINAIIDNQADVSLTFDFTSTVTNIKTLECNTSSSFTFGQQADVELGTDAGVLPTVIKEDTVTIVSISSVIADIGVIKSTGSTIASNVTMSVEAETVKSASMIITGAFNTSVTATGVRLDEVVCDIQSSLEVDVLVIKDAVFDNAILAGCVTQPQAVYVSGGNITARSLISATVGTLTISTDRTYIVPAETRAYRLPAETRSHTITRENREYSIKGAA